MTSYSNVIAIDLGAESGRIISANLADNHISLNVVHRFPNNPVTVNNTIYWNILRLWHEIQAGIDACMEYKPASIGVDTWGLDFGLLDHSGQLIGNPIHYRDASRIGMLNSVSKKIPLKEIYEITGIQLMDINGIYQLVYLAENSPKLLNSAKTFLTIPDLINYFLTGAKACEYTNATTTQAFDPRHQNWAYNLLEKLELPTEIFPKVIQPGTPIGEFNKIPVIAPACHDTASAVAAVPATTADYAYISSGTWSLMGLEVSEPIITNNSFKANITNEGGVDGTFRFLKNIMGLWILQQCRATWLNQGNTFDYPKLIEMANKAEPFSAMIDPDHKAFLPHGNMPQRIIDYCKDTKQSPPNDIGILVRCVLESLAFKYRQVLDLLIQVSGQPVEIIHIIGGGSQNKLLCQMTANATNRVVVAGPVEAAALGNALVQWWSSGIIDSISAGRRLISKSVDLEYYTPENQQLWNEQYHKYLSILGL